MTALLVQRERYAPDHAAIILAAHQARIDDAAGGEGADEARRADLPEIGIDLDLGEHGAVRVHGVVRLRGRVGRALAAPFDFGEAGAGEDVGVALASALVVAAEQPAAARDDAGVAGAEQRRAFVARGEIRELGDHVGAGVVDRHAGRRGVAPSRRRCRHRADRTCRTGTRRRSMSRPSPSAAIWASAVQAP